MTTTQLTRHKAEFANFSRPLVAEKLEQLKLNRTYTWSEGNYLYYNDEGMKEQKVLDFISGYGSLFLGHNYPKLNDYAQKLLKEKIPIHAQMSSKTFVGTLAKSISDELFESTGHDYICTFSNSGTEAVEAAIKHAKLAFTKKKNSFFDNLHQIFNKLNNHFVKENLPFAIPVNGKLLDFQEFKAHFISTASKTFEANPTFMLAAQKGFHGKTTGALSLTYNDYFKTDFTTDEKNKSSVKYFDTEHLDDIDEILANSIVTLSIPSLSHNGEYQEEERKFCICLGIVIEPLQGEGGVHPIPKAFLTGLRERADNFDIPLIFDEIQCGFFRTGKLMHSLTIGVNADYYTLGKSIGGGMVKNAALLVRQDKYVEGFGFLHTSTFADDDFTAAISLKAFECSKELAKKVPEIHEYFLKSLGEVKATYPKVIKEIRGAGLMLGIEFFDLNHSDNYCYQAISRSGFFNYYITSYLLSCWGIRVAPTLSDSQTLRIQPSILTTKEEIDRFQAALLQCCKIIQYNDFYKFVEHFLDEEDKNLRELQNFGYKEIALDTDPTLENVGFITHLLHAKNARMGDKSIAVLSDQSIRKLLRKFIPVSEPFVTGATIVTSETGKKVNAYFIGLLFTAQMVRDIRSPDESFHYERNCSSAIKIFKEEFNCKIVGLGQYTSVITGNGLKITDSDISLTTGNSFTVSIGVQALKSETEKIEGPITLGILGAGGNISSVYAQCFVPYCSKIILKGSGSKRGILKTQKFANNLIRYIFKLLAEESVDSKNWEKLKTTKAFQCYLSEETPSIDLFEIIEAELGEECPILIIDNLNHFYECNATVVATNNPNPFLGPEHFSPNSIVYDISVPINCTQELINNDINIKVLLGGIVKLPSNEKLPMKGFPLSRGECFACISETILLGLEGIESCYSFGKLTPEQVNRIGEIGCKHGFVYLKPKIEKIF